MEGILLELRLIEQLSLQQLRKLKDWYFDYLVTGRSMQRTKESRSKVKGLSWVM